MAAVQCMLMLCVSGCVSDHLQCEGLRHESQRLRRRRVCKLGSARGGHATGEMKAMMRQAPVF